MFRGYAEELSQAYRFLDYTGHRKRVFSKEYCNVKDKKPSKAFEMLAINNAKLLSETNLMWSYVGVHENNSNVHVGKDPCSYDLAQSSSAVVKYQCGELNMIWPDD